ncbi:AAA family ATPase [Candidatus Venteria ishoeyi]|uniref:ATPase RavA n=1 Tax=Candidatus Venteria ishoeyi TaxID=1899563 RepID=A0A1H6F807_9GAMM|nr:MoxR family ATPase [Candidatus Venteria ishoeyi]MDM8548169.1 MoxR family ATPase [Candidatus Venteria ishoeyi]SEH05194.1 ATPase RavA [Candidatus Venteria ishoeyi]
MNTQKNPEQTSLALPSFEELVTEISQVILGKEYQVRQLLACLFAQGHILIEDLPGMGKTTLAHVLARVLGLSFQRIQFTSDLLPADILGVSVYDRETAQFKFHKGPIFAQMILADEVNRATPKAQSALLEAMEERQVTVEGETRALPAPFFVLATQNPMHQIGTFPLPESQLDRFMMRLELGYPDHQAERALLKGQDRRQLIEQLSPKLNAEQVLTLQSQVPNIILSDALIDYVQAILQHSRNAPQFRFGLSPRAGLALLRAAQAWALLHGRDFVLPEDIQALLPAIAGHRLFPANGQDSPQKLVQSLIKEVAIP